MIVFNSNQGRTNVSDDNRPPRKDARKDAQPPKKN